MPSVSCAKAAAPSGTSPDGSGPHAWCRRGCSALSAAVHPPVPRGSPPPNRASATHICLLLSSWRRTLGPVSSRGVVEKNPWSGLFSRRRPSIKDRINLGAGKEPSVRYRRMSAAVQAPSPSWLSASEPRQRHAHLPSAVVAEKNPRSGFDDLSTTGTSCGASCAGLRRASRECPPFVSVSERLHWWPVRGRLQK